MTDITNLIQEAKPLYFARKRRRNQLKAAFVALMLIIGVNGLYQPNPAYIYNFDSMDNELNLTQSGSVIEEMGLPTDEFGLLMIG